MLIYSSISTHCLYSQTTTIDNKKLRDAAKLIEKGKICEQRVSLLNEKISLLYQRIALKDSIILSSGVKDNANIELLKSYKEEVANLTQQRDIASKEMKQQNKLLKRAKRRTVLIGVLAPAVTAAIFLIVNK